MVPAFADRTSPSRPPRRPNLSEHGDAHRGAASRRPGRAEPPGRRSQALAGARAPGGRCGRRSGSRTCSSSPACSSRGSSNEGPQVVDALITFVAFCAISSAGYLFNDLRDAPLDRQPSREAPPADRQRGAVGAAWPWSPPWRSPSSRSGSRFVTVSAGVAGLVALYGVTTVAYSADPQAPRDHRRDDDRLAVHPPRRRRRRRGRGPRLGVAAPLHRRCWRCSSASPSAARRRCGIVPAALRPEPEATDRGEAACEASGSTTRPVLEHYSLPFLDQMVAMVTAGRDHQLRDLRRQLPADRQQDAARPLPRSSTASSATST